MMSQPEHTLPAKFWARFVKLHWEKRPVVIKRPFAQPFITPEETFAALVTSSDQYRSGEDVASHLYIEYAQLIAEVWKHLPASDDGSLGGYANRMKHEFQGQRFGLVASDFQVYGPELWLRLRDFLRGLFEVTGIPGSRTNSAVFLGNYEKTPLGLHEADSSNFIFVVEGRKRLRVWPGPVLQRHGVVTHSLDYEKFLGESIALEGEPGDILYWPSTYWHIGESVDGGLAASLSVAVFLNAELPVDLSSVAERAEEQLTASRRASTFPLDPHRLQATVRKLPRMAVRTARAFNSAMSDSQTSETLQVDWINSLTRFGFAKVPPPMAPRALSDHEVVRGDPHYPILWIAAESDETICSANGHAFSVTAHPRVLKLFERINTGEPYSVGQLIRSHSGVARVGQSEVDLTGEDVRGLLEKLHSLRALQSRS